MNKLQYIIQEIQSINIHNKYVKKAKKDRIDFYTATADKLGNISDEQIKKFSFISEVLRMAEDLEKAHFAPILLDKVTKLETHQNAPELNILHFKDKHIKTPQAKTIAEAITQIIRNNSLNSLIKLNFEI